jgi:polysaccharide biosynthesis protein PslH
MPDASLQLLSVSPFPPSPPSFGAQRRMQGLLSALARRHSVTALTLVSPTTDRTEVERAMRDYCREVSLVTARDGRGLGKRWTQLRALASPRSFERLSMGLPAFQAELRRLLASRSFDVVLLEFPFLAADVLADLPLGSHRPIRVLDEHNIEFDLARQQAGREHGLLRRVHNAVNWPKLQREELDAFRRFDGVAFCSAEDAERARALVPSVNAAVVPNAVDVREFAPTPELPRPDGRTVLFFGAINYFPNVDGILFLLKEVWPLIAASRPSARLKIVGQHPTREILAFRGPRVEVTGRVDDVRPHLASAAVTIVPLRIGGGTRFKILEAMAMGRPVVSTALGAEGIDARPERELLLADDAAGLAAAVQRVLDDPALARALGEAGRTLVQQRYSWDAAAGTLEQFLLSLAGRMAGEAAAGR